MTENQSAKKTYASFYDFYDGPGGREGQFGMYRELATEAAGPVLELACGTCLITIELARAGFEVTGLDFSPDMLDVARRKIEREDADVRDRLCLVEGDMREFRLDGAFGLIFVASNTFGYLTETAHHQSCLRCARDHLREGGLLVIEERFYTPHALVRLSDRRGAVVLHEANVNPETGLYTTFSGATRYVDPVRQMVYARGLVDEVQEDGTIKRYISEQRSPRWGDVDRYFTPLELRLLLESAGLEVVEVWGGHDKRPLRRDSDNMIFVARRAGHSDDAN